MGAIRLGLVGCGRTGTSLARKVAANVHLQAALVAVCDLDSERARSLGEALGAEPLGRSRELLDREDVDAVLVAAPGHWHARLSREAMLAGKDVWCEEPVGLTVREVEEVAETARQTGRIYQIGVPALADPGWRMARKYLLNGLVGKPVWSQVGLALNLPDGEGNETSLADRGHGQVPWTEWLGPAPFRAFDPERLLRHRKFFDYAIGVPQVRLGVGLYNLVAALRPGLPCRVSSIATRAVHPNREVPDTCQVMIDYASEQSIVMACSTASISTLDFILRGHEGTIRLEPGEVLVNPERIYAKDREVLRCPVAAPSDLELAHLADFLESIRTRLPPAGNVDLAREVGITLALVREALMTGTVVSFDPHAVAPRRG